MAIILKDMDTVYRDMKFLTVPLSHFCRRTFMLDSPSQWAIHPLKIISRKENEKMLATNFVKTGH